MLILPLLCLFFAQCRQQQPLCLFVCGQRDEIIFSNRALFSLFPPLSPVQGPLGKCTQDCIFQRSLDAEPRKQRPCSMTMMTNRKVMWFFFFMVFGR
ncbi:hypothetical protein BC939DRAFT_446442 [Gamsiella multidivaricata]|uniref:uncharacterized protein n=1 Tax=Gamsiella multidivaricata TaxID=101098 RepID=UPI00221EBC95|nr:uncharacterized protein BC939DRAFT_446442 [Gamsiella multidivaricata]KAI7826991.1 hypothetical protein BC939DRAFT_446442 [Gamsiella multidivaricata]